MLFATAAIAVFLGLRDGYVYGSSADISTIIDRAWWVAWGMAVMVCMLFCAEVPFHVRRRVIVVNATLVGGVAAAITAGILGFEIANKLEAAYPDYWAWNIDYLLFAIYVVGRAWIWGMVIGAIVGSIWGMSSPRRRLAATHHEQR
jgi:hypothetical protein